MQEARGGVDMCDQQMFARSISRLEAGREEAARSLMAIEERW
jgi:hypothetical protein